MIEFDERNLIVWFYHRHGWLGVTRRDYLMAMMDRDGTIGALVRDIDRGELWFTYDKFCAPIERKWCFFV